VKAFIHPFVIFFASLGGAGIFLLGILDGSLLFLPLGIDLLLVGLTAHHHDRWLYYAAMATMGSVIGCYTTDWVGRKGGEAGVEKRISKRQLRFIQKRVHAGAGTALAIASVAPPGFPFTPVVLVAAALKYPRVKLLTIIAIFRFIRFTTEALLAIRYGRHILKIAESRTVETVIFAVVVISVIGSAWLVSSWLKAGRGQSARSHG